MDNRNRGIIHQLHTVCLKQPGTYMLMIAGILVDVVIQLPFIIICTIENIFRRQNKSSSIKRLP